MALIKNVGSTDQLIRIVAGVVLIALAFFKLGGFATAGGVVAVIVGAVLIVTAALNFCPLYRILGMRTTKQTTNAE